MWTVGIDVGGTFTDLFAQNLDTGEARSSKALTTPENRAHGVLDAIDAAGLRARDISQLTHGTTTATNALIERSFPEAAMITTEGFRDVIEIGRMHREHLYRPYQTKPVPLIKRRNRHVVVERVSVKGAVETPVDEADLARIVPMLNEAGVKSVAVCFINSYVNAANEHAVANYLTRECPDVKVVCSADVKPVFREHTRFSTAVVRTVLLPVMAEYFSGLEEKLDEQGFSGSLMILKSNGGMMSVDQARSRVEELVESGPAGGIGYAAAISEMTGAQRIIHTDVGGTSFDTSIVEKGEGLITREYEIEFDIPVAVPMLDIRSIGAGGGSVGWVDNGGSLRVGPESAGSVPGPACYGRGGSRPTITDANFILGRLNPDLSGKFKLDFKAAQTAMRTIAKPLGLSIEECADGMIRVATEAMGQAVKIVMASRGRDPRDFALASFGGAGPLHACAVADVLSIQKVIVPKYSGVASAFGATRLKLRHDEEVFHFATMGPDAMAGIQAGIVDLETKASDALLVQGVEPGDITVSHFMRMRYAGQTFEVDVAQASDSITSDDVAGLIEQFHQTHQTEFGVRSDDFNIEVVALAVTAEGGAPADVNYQSTEFETDDTGGRSVYFNSKWHDTPITAAEGLAANNSLSGPLLVEDPHTLIVVPPGWSIMRDAYGNCIMEVAK